MGELFYHFGVALAIGLLIGMEREFKKSDEAQQFLFGGIRTFPLLALTGCSAAMLGDLMNSPWGFVLPIVITGAFLVVAYLGTVNNRDFGMTTEVAALLTVIIGVFCYYGQIELAVALGIIVLVLLSFKVKLHEFSKMLTREEIVSLAKFGLMTAIVLPILPNEPTLPAPFDVLILRNIWLMVVLVTAIGMVGYFLKKLIANRKAIVLTGFIGGLVSSTAVTLSFSSLSKGHSTLSKAYAVAIIVSWITMFLRIVAEVAVVNTNLVKDMWIPMTAAAIAGGLYCWFLYNKDGKHEAISDNVEVEKPFSLKKSLIFGGLYAAVIVIANIAQINFGDKGIYLSAIAAGFTDVDAITLSMAEMSRVSGSVDPDVAIRAISLAAVSNTLVKASIVFTTAHKVLKKEILPGLLLIVLAALATVFFI
ncbi:MgtC/SapB family protein [Cyclobacterium amurskyense]|uniref:MgtC/SapB family protein n=1 Tax=Cyclobacterium amurskyense TaxID=320787 RepID=UPI0030D8675A|tara:strand:- start:4644 stop:5906 length:1263 start_codon:yes stop_codon:yes gene_type:complete